MSFKFKKLKREVKPISVKGLHSIKEAFAMGLHSIKEGNVK